MARSQRLIRDRRLLLRSRARRWELMMRGWRRRVRPAWLVDIIQAVVRDHICASVCARATVTALVAPSDRPTTGLAWSLGLAERGDLVALHANAWSVLICYHSHDAALAALAVRTVCAALLRCRLLVLWARAGALAARLDALRRGVMDRVAMMLGRTHIRSPPAVAATVSMSLLHTVVESFGFGVQVSFGNGAGMRFRCLISRSAIMHDFTDSAEGALDVVHVPCWGRLRADGEQ